MLNYTKDERTPLELLSWEKNNGLTVDASAHRRIMYGQVHFVAPVIQLHHYHIRKPIDIDSRCTNKNNHHDIDYYSSSEPSLSGKSKKLRDIDADATLAYEYWLYSEKWKQKDPWMGFGDLE